MKVIDLTEATETLATYAADVAQGPVIITVGGKPVTALVAIENADLETVSLSTNPAFLALIEALVGDVGQRLLDGSADRALSVGDDPHNGHGQGTFDLAEQLGKVVLCDR